ncbi:MAG: hypothetical protein ABI837_11925 [Acidobacteriota bacterium]
MQGLYEPMISRDVAALPAAVRRFRATHSQDELFAAVARFAVLAFAPSQHSKHALLSCLSAHELRVESGSRYDDLLTECAIYASSSRQPWSEPPVSDPPAIDRTQRGDLDELRAAIQSKDRLRGERWLARRLEDESLPADLLRVASEDFDDLGHKVIIATASWRLASILGTRGLYVTLRNAIAELTGYHSAETYRERGVALDEASLLERLVDCAEFEKGSLPSTHAIFLLDAGLEASEVAKDPGISARVRDFLTGSTSECAPGESLPPAPVEVPIYRLARDYGQFLKSYAVAKRLRRRFPNSELDRFLAATQHNLLHGPSFEEFSFA